MEALGELDNGVDPFAKASDTLHAVEHHAIAKNQFALVWLGPERKCVALSEEKLSSKVSDRQESLTHQTNLTRDRRVRNKDGEHLLHCSLGTKANSQEGCL